METVKFLRDIENELAFAQGLELAYIDAFNAATAVSNRMGGDALQASTFSQPKALADRHKELRHVLFTMSLVIRDCVDRRRRLANVAAGLSDVVFDEETP